jgi:hypothetical protein
MVSSELSCFLWTTLGQEGQSVDLPISSQPKYGLFCRWHSLLVSGMNLLMKFTMFLKKAKQRRDVSLNMNISIQRELGLTEEM